MTNRPKCIKVVLKIASGGESVMDQVRKIVDEILNFIENYINLIKDFIDKFKKAE